MKKLLLIITTGFLLFSCSKDEKKSDEVTPAVTSEESNYPASRDELISNLTKDDSKSWGESSFTTVGIGVQECRADDVMRLKNDGTYIYNNGEILCGDDVQSKSGTWETNFEAKTITFDKGTSEENTAEISSATQNELAVKGVWNGITITGIYSVL